MLTHTVYIQTREEKKLPKQIYAAMKIYFSISHLFRCEYIGSWQFYVIFLQIAIHHLAIYFFFRLHFYHPSTFEWEFSF